MASFDNTRLIFYGESADEEMENYIFHFEKETNSSFVRTKSRISMKPGVFDRTLLKGRIYWEESSTKVLPMPLNGIPFVVTGREVKQCAYGPDRSAKKDDDESLREKKNSRKVNCPAAIQVRSVLIFPQYQLSCIDSKYEKFKVSQRLRADLDNPKTKIDYEHQIHVILPMPEDHRFHIVDDTYWKSPGECPLKICPPKDTPP